MRYRLCEVEEKMQEMELEREPDTELEAVETESGKVIVMTDWWAYIPELNMSLRKGTLWDYDRENSEYELDCDITLLYMGEVGKVDYLHYGFGGFTDTLEFWLNDGMERERIEQLWCEVVVGER